MCQYAGGKARIGKKIFEAMKSYEMEVIGNHDMPYFEPFVGMGGVLQHVAKNQSRTISVCDFQECIMSFWRGIQSGWTPKPIDKCVYNKTKKDGSESDPYFAFIAFGCSFRGMKWGGFFKDSMERAIRRIQRLELDVIFKNVNFIDARSYTEHSPNGCMIYCDPPYNNSSFDSRKSNLLNFDTCEFWENMRFWSMKNLVFISEREAPPDFDCILEFTRKNGMNSGIIIEKLFVFNRTFKI